MNYPFIIESLQQNLQFKRFWGFIFAVGFFSFSQGQVMILDSLYIQKSWTDKNGINTLSINVNALCNPNKPPFDGQETKINAELVNNEFSLKQEYNDKDYQMEMLQFYEKDIWFYKYKEAQAVFIPFFYCANLDNEVKVSYIIFYNNSWLDHFYYKCTEEGDCWLNDKLEKKVDDLSIKIRKELVKQLKPDIKTILIFI